MKREELIQLCIDAVVHHTKWTNRDSYCAQKSIQSIYEGLTAGLDFRVVTEEINPDYYSNSQTILVEFIQPIDFEKLKNGEYLETSSREDYFNDCDPDYENDMFDGTGIDFESHYTQSYMPTRERLEWCGEGNDWY